MIKKIKNKKDQRNFEGKKQMINTCLNFKWSFKIV